MSQIKNKIVDVALAVLASMMFCFAPMTQAEPVSSTTPFEHSRTGFVLRDVHTTLRCEQCHVAGIFKNTPRDCAGCHSIGSRVGATPKPVNHVKTTKTCETCHVSATSFQVKSFKHFGISSDCASCHNGQSMGVVSKNANHIPTLLPCENCHTNTTTFTIARMDHAGITSGCASCHNGSKAKGKSSTHIATGTADCGLCHTIFTFLGAKYDHSTVVAGTCDTCHLGQFAGVVSKPAIHITTGGAKCDACHTAANTSGYTSFLGGKYDHVTPAATGVCSTCHTGQISTVLGKPANHIATSAQCDACHTASNTSNYKTFVGATYTHASPAGVCSVCHNGVSAKGKSAVHIPTTAACDTCHTQVNTSNYTTFLGAVYVHPTPPGVCSTCHNNVTAKGKPALHVATNAACDLCHTQANTANYTTFLGAAYAHASPPGVCSTCHNGVTALGKHAGHMVTTAPCDSCHTQANTSNYTTFLGATGAVDHTSLPAGNCQSCHNGASAKGKSAGHIPVVISCDGCHQKYNGTTVVTFAPGTMNHTLVTSITCYSCHNGSYTSQGTMGAKAMPLNHIPVAITGGAGGLPCTTCHTPTYTSASGWAAEKMNHNGALGGGAPVYCVTCHLTGTSYMGTMDKKSHQGTSTAKDCSSANCHKPLGKFGVSYSKWN